MIASFHLATPGLRRAPGLLRQRLEPAAIPGLRHGNVLATAKLEDGLIPPATPGRIALLTTWEDDAALDAFLDSGHPLLDAFAGGWSTRLRPLREVGTVAGFSPLVEEEEPAAPDEPVCVLTYGRTQFRTLPPFLRANRIATVQAASSPAFVTGVGITRPPRTIGTFSIWSSSAGMRDYATGNGSEAPGHSNAIRAEREGRWHLESTFVRFRPYASAGTWDGRDPLAAIPVASA